MLRIILTSFVSLALAGSCPVALAAAQNGNVPPARVALVDGIKFTVAGIPKTVNERDRFFSTFRDALAGKGWATADPIPDDRCTGVADCLPAVAGLAKAEYALRLTGDGNLKYGYTINVELYSRASSQTQRTTAFCDICNTDRMAGIAADFAAGLLTAAVKDEQASKSRRRDSRVAMSGAPQTPSDPPQVPRAPPQPSDARLGWVPWTITAVGVAAVAYGTWALSQNGNATGASYAPSPSSYAQDTYASRGVGLASVIGGGVLLATGIVWFVVSPSKSTTVAASPSRVTLSLRF